MPLLRALAPHRWLIDVRSAMPGAWVAVEKLCAPGKDAGGRLLPGVRAVGALSPPPPVEPNWDGLITGPCPMHMKRVWSVPGKPRLDMRSLRPSRISFSSTGWSLRKRAI